MQAGAALLTVDNRNSKMILVTSEFWRNDKNVNTRTKFRDCQSSANIILKTLSISKTFHVQNFVTWQLFLFRHMVARLKRVANGTRKIQGLGNLCSDLEISEAFWNLEISFSCVSLSLGFSNFGLEVSESRIFVSEWFRSKLWWKCLFD